jgi:hypothetical protein
MNILEIYSMLLLRHFFCMQRAHSLHWLLAQELRSPSPWPPRDTEVFTSNTSAVAFNFSEPWWMRKAWRDILQAPTRIYSFRFRTVTPRSLAPFCFPGTVSIEEVPPRAELPTAARSLPSFIASREIIAAEISMHYFFLINATLPLVLDQGVWRKVGWINQC